MSRADEIAQGLREPSGALIGGLYVEEYVQGIEDYVADRPPPKVTTTSYDLGRARAREKDEAKADAVNYQRAESARSRAVIREMMAGRPDLLAEFNAKMAEIDARWPNLAPPNE